MYKKSKGICYPYYIYVRFVQRFGYLYYIVLLALFDNMMYRYYSQNRSLSPDLSKNQFMWQRSFPELFPKILI